MKRSCPIFCMLLVWCLSSGCLGKPRAYLAPDCALHNLTTVAVVPFDNETDRREAGEIVSSIFVEELYYSKRFQVLEVADIREMMTRERIHLTKSVDRSFLKKVGQRLGVDGIILGRVDMYWEGEGKEGGAVPVVAVSARLIETAGGSILWSCSNRRTGDDYEVLLDIGKVRTALQLSHLVAEEMVEMMEDKKCEAIP